MNPSLPDGWPYTAGSKRKGARREKTQRLAWDPARKKRLENLWRDNVDVEEIADMLETTRGAIYAKVHELRLGRRRARGFTAAKRARTRKPGGRQRRFAGVEKKREGARVVLEPHHPASRKGSTIFPSTVIPASRLQRVLISGVNSRKIGATVEKGAWMGNPIFTLTLEERDTCPRTCKEWATCYGNNMHLAQRVYDDGTLERRLWGELASLNAAHPGGFVVRLHVLGDFYSVGYVHFWRQSLVDFPALRIFGFTARKPQDPIGAQLIFLDRDEPERFKMRFSGAGRETHCSEVVDKPEQATGILCPAESDPKRCCATCGLCWTSDRTISFLRH